MKNTTFRKKALLSSVAMLLVALVALGSATFAWFTANPNADATGIQMKTTASTGLVIRTDSDTTYSHNAKLYKGQTEIFNLDPVSQVQAAPATFYTIGASDAGDEAASATEKFSTASVGTHSNTTGMALYSEKVYFKLSDGTAAGTTGKVNLASVVINAVEGADMAGCIRVAVANSDDELIGTYALSNAAPNKTVPADSVNKKMSEVTLVDYSPVLKANLTSGTAGTANVEASNVGTAEDATNNFVTVYVYLDGQDANCYSDNVGIENAAQIISGITLNFTLAPAAQG